MKAKASDEIRQRARALGWDAIGATWRELDYRLDTKRIHVAYNADGGVGKAKFIRDGVGVTDTLGPGNRLKKAQILLWLERK